MKSQNTELEYIQLHRLYISLRLIITSNRIDWPVMESPDLLFEKDPTGLKFCGKRINVWRVVAATKITSYFRGQVTWSAVPFWKDYKGGEILSIRGKLVAVEETIPAML